MTGFVPEAVLINLQLQYSQMMTVMRETVEIQRRVIEDSRNRAGPNETTPPNKAASAVSPGQPVHGQGIRKISKQVRMSLIGDPGRVPRGQPTGATPSSTSWGIPDTPGDVVPQDRRSEIISGANAPTLKLKAPSMSEVMNTILNKFPVSDNLTTKVNTNDSNRDNKLISPYNPLTSFKLEIAASTLATLGLGLDENSNILALLSEQELSNKLTATVPLGTPGSWELAEMWLRHATRDSARTASFEQKLHGDRHTFENVGGYVTKGVQRYIEHLLLQAVDHDVDVAPTDVYRLWKHCLSKHPELLQECVTEWTTHEHEYKEGTRASLDMLEAVMIVETAVQIANASRGRNGVNVTLTQPNTTGQVPYGVKSQRGNGGNGGNSRNNNRSNQGRTAGSSSAATGTPHPQVRPANANANANANGNSNSPKPLTKISNNGNQVYLVGPGQAGGPQSSGHEGCRRHHSAPAGAYIGHRELDHKSYGQANAIFATSGTATAYKVKISGISGPVSHRSKDHDYESPDSHVRSDPISTVALFDTGSVASFVTHEAAVQCGAIINYKPTPKTYDTANMTTFSTTTETTLVVELGSYVQAIKFDVVDTPFPYPVLLNAEDGRSLGFTITHGDGVQPVNVTDGRMRIVTSITEGKPAPAVSTGPLPVPERLDASIKQAVIDDDALNDDTNNYPYGPHTEEHVSVKNSAGEHMYFTGTGYNATNSLYHDLLHKQFVAWQEENQTKNQGINKNLPLVGIKQLPGTTLPWAPGSTSPHHLKEQVQEMLQSMIDRGEIKEEIHTGAGIHSRPPHLAAVRVWVKQKPSPPSVNPGDPPKRPGLRLLFDCRAVNRCIDTSNRLGTGVVSLEEFQLKIAPLNAIFTADYHGGFQQVGTRYADPIPGQPDRVETLQENEFAVVFNVDRRWYRMTTLSQGLNLSPDAFVSTVLYRDPSVLRSDNLKDTDVYVDDKATGANVVKVAVSPSKYADALASASQDSTYESMLHYDISPIPGEEPIEMYDLSHYYSRIKEHYRIQNGPFGMRDSPAKTYHLMRTVVLGGLLVGSGSIGIDAKKRAEIGLIETPTTTMGLRKVVHYLLWLCRIVRKLAVNLKICYKYTSIVSKTDLRKLAGDDYPKIEAAIAKVCADLNESDGLCSIRDDTFLCIVTDSSRFYHACTLTQTTLDPRTANAWDETLYAKFIKDCNDLPIAHYSKSNPDNDGPKGAGFWEMKAMVEGLKAFEFLIRGKVVGIVNDNKPAIASLLNDEPSDQVWRMIYVWNLFYNVVPIWINGKYDLAGVDSGSRLRHRGDLRDTGDLASALKDPGPIHDPETLGVHAITRSRAPRNSPSSAVLGEATTTGNDTGAATNTNDTGATTTGGTTTSDGSIGTTTSARTTPIGKDNRPLPVGNKTSKADDLNDLDDDDDTYRDNHLRNPHIPDMNDNDVHEQDMSSVTIEDWPPEFRHNGVIVPPRSSKRLRNKYLSGILFKPPDGMVNEIIGNTHDLSGHYGDQQMAHHLWRLGFYIPNFRQAARDYKERCTPCMRYDIATRRYNEVERDAWYVQRHNKVVCMDTGSFPSDDQGYNTVSTITDAFTGFTSVRASKDKSAQEAIAHLKDWIATHGTPEKVCTDGAYNNAGFKSFLESVGTKHSVIPPYYPSGNGFAEDAQKHVKVLMAKTTYMHPGAWSDEIWKVSFTINNNIRSRTGMTPYYAVFHQHPNLPFQSDDSDDGNDVTQVTRDADERLHRRINETTPLELEAALIRLEKYHDKRDERFSKRKTQVLMPGQWVNLIESDPVARKTAPRTTGPFEVASILPGRKVILYNNESPRGILTDSNGSGIVSHTSWLKVAPEPTKYEKLSEARYPSAPSTSSSTSNFGPTTRSRAAPGGSTSSASSAQGSSGTSSGAEYAIDSITGSRNLNGTLQYRVSWSPSWVSAPNIDPTAIDTYNRAVNAKKGSARSSRTSH
jgi:transposase InsO family protein